jgi:methionyl-tRNA synthetase
MDAMDIRKASSELRAIWVAGNEYLQTAAPWAKFKEDPDAAAAVIRLSLNLIRLYAVLSKPFIPDASAALLTAMNTDDESWPDNIATALDTLPAGHTFTVPEVTFAKITDAQRIEWNEKFAGTRD